MTNTWEVKPMVAFSPVALVRVFSSIKEEPVVRTVIKIKYSVGGQKGLKV